MFGNLPEVAMLVPELAEGREFRFSKNSIFLAFFSTPLPESQQIGLKDP